MTTIRTLALVLVTSLAATALAQDNPLDKLKPAVAPPVAPPIAPPKAAVVKHRMEILNGNRLTVAYFATPNATDQDLDGLAMQARREEDKFNRRIPDLEITTPAGVLLANVRPGDAVGAGPTVTIILKGGATKTGELVRITDTILSLRTADEDLDVLRSEVAAMSRKR